MSKELFETYGHKLKTVEELQEVLGPLPREQKVVMCHGVFDVIHPGHLRHLIYAKEKAEILIVSLTADLHITKGIYRPHVPERLRAVNMAAFELVDYVVIDRNATPISNLKAIEPDFFAKGYEYRDDGTLDPKTQEEVDTLESYGGQMIFTPGDFVYSSSKLINVAPPDLKYEKLSLLMSDEGVGFDDLRTTLNKMVGRRVHVVGDTIVDSYTRCAMIGGQTKTPTMSVLYQEREDFIGGAGIVAKHLRAAGADVVFSTVLGDDALKTMVLDGLAEAGIDCRAHIDPLRPTTNKNAIVVRDYRLLKIDTLDNASVPATIVDALVEDIRTSETDAVIFSDFRHGLFNRSTIPTFVEAVPEGRVKAADSQVASRWGNITEFKGFDLITPNEREARFALADQDSGVRPLASTLYDAAQCKNLILKMGDKGLLTCRTADHESPDSYFLVDAFVERLVDGVGAGDALLAYGTLALLVSGSVVQAAILGALAAGCECEYDGNIPITPHDVTEKLSAIETMMAPH